MTFVGPSHESGSRSGLEESLVSQTCLLTMLLWGVNPQSLVREESVDFSSDVALETSNSFLLGQSFLGASIYVRGGAGVNRPCG